MNEVDATWFKSTCSILDEIGHSPWEINFWTLLSLYSVIVRVRVVLNRTVVGD